MDSILYPHRPINSLKALNRALKVDEATMSDALDNIDYREVLLKKKDGSTRVAYDASPYLKTVQKKITTHIFHGIIFPDYIHGCIRDTSRPRNIYTNASPHAGKKQIILCDIKDFFPSVSEGTVLSIFRECLGFSPSVARRLTDLCTFNGSLPQGASTSSYLANLVFWDIEPALVAKLADNGFTYTRFADDITISIDRHIEKNEKTQALNHIRKAIRKRGCSLKKKKTMVLKRGQAIIGKSAEKQELNHSPITVTSLSIHHKHLTITKKERRNVRAAVHRLEKTDMAKVSPQEWSKRYASAMGKVSRLVSCGHKEGEPLKQRLKGLKATHRRLHQRSSKVSGRK